MNEWRPSRQDLDEATYLRLLLDTMPHMVLVLKQDLTVVDANREATRMLGTDPDVVLRFLCGEVLRCFNALSEEGCCGTTRQCPDCIVRQGVEAAAAGMPLDRRIGQMLLQRPTGTQTIWLAVTAAPFPGDEGLVLLVMEDVSELIRLRHFLPICSYCHRVRDHEDTWLLMEEYLKEHGPIQFTHGLCPDCLRENYPEEADEVLRRIEAQRVR